MPGTYLDMQTRIADELSRSDLSSQITNAIQTAIQDYEGERFWFNEQRFTLNTVANQSWYDEQANLLNEDGSALATGVKLLEVDQMVCNFGNWFQPLKPVAPGWIDTYQIPTYIGQPYYYARLGTRIRLAPTPNDVYTVTITGLARLVTLSANSDTNAWLTEGEKLIRSRAKAILWRSILRNADEAALCDAEEQVALSALQRKENARHTMRLEPWGY